MSPYIYGLVMVVVCSTNVYGMAMAVVCSIDVMTWLWYVPQVVCYARAR